MTRPLNPLFLFHKSKFSDQATPSGLTRDGGLITCPRQTGRGDHRSLGGDDDTHFNGLSSGCSVEPFRKYSKFEVIVNIQLTNVVNNTHVS